jgi:predicted dehydrogenase
MTEIIQIGVLGCGEMGRSLSQAVAATGLGRIRSVFDSHAERSSALARVHQAEAAATEEILLANKDLQAIIVALPPFAHCESVLKIAQAGKHVFLEKPMALKLA